MAAQNYETGFQNHYAGRFKNITKDSTYEDIRELYDNWAKDFEQVYQLYNLNFLNACMNYAKTCNYSCGKLPWVLRRKIFF